MMATPDAPHGDSGPHRGATSPGGVTTTRSNRIWLDDEGILHVEALPGSEQTLADAEETVAVSWEVGGRRMLRILVDGRRIKSMNREARAYYGGPLAKTMALATGLLTGSPLSCVLGNVYLSFNKPLYPSRLFTSEREAIAWLLSIVA